MLIARITALAGLALAASLAVSPAQALTMTECSVKYKAAKDAGETAKWNDFRKAECGSDDAATAPAAPAAIPVAKPSPSSAAPAAADDDAKGLTMAQCSAKYQSAKDAGTPPKWNDFRKSECGPGADPVAFTTDGSQEPAAPTIAAPRGVSFPTGISSKYASQTPGKARMHTCLDQYYANKTNNSLGGLKWIQKGGGYYSLCNVRLKS